MAVLMWLYSWFFMWRHLITPKVSASDKLELMLRKSRVVKWNIETIGVSANGFNAYFLFKVLMWLWSPSFLFRPFPFSAAPLLNCARARKVMANISISTINRICRPPVGRLTRILKQPCEGLNYVWH